MAAFAPLLTRRGVLLGAASLLLSSLFLLGSLSRYSESLIPFSQSSRENNQVDLLDDIANSTLGFEKIFVVSLQKRTDRRDRIVLGAAATGLDFEWIDAVSEVNRDALPPGSDDPDLGMQDPHFGHWRSTMNVARKIIKEGISTALILEDDADWDVRIKSQMRDYARAARLLVQPLVNTTDKRLDPTYPQPLSEDEIPTSFYVGRGLENRTTAPTTSPYGDVDHWDMHWFGHCGVRFPYAEDEVPLARAVLLHDKTVANPYHLTVQFGDEQLLEQYPPHTRVVSRGRYGVCTQAYALTQNGARKILWEMGLKNITAPTDIMYRHMCDGTWGRRRIDCYFPQPALFLQHQPRGSLVHASSIEDGKRRGYIERAVTPNLRLSTMVNLERLVNGEKELIDQYGDDDEDYVAERIEPDYYSFGITWEDEEEEEEDSDGGEEVGPKATSGQQEGVAKNSGLQDDGEAEHTETDGEDKPQHSEIWTQGTSEDDGAKHSGLREDVKSESVGVHEHGETDYSNLWKDGKSRAHDGHENAEKVTNEQELGKSGFHDGHENVEKVTNEQKEGKPKFDW